MSEDDLSDFQASMGRIQSQPRIADGLYPELPPNGQGIAALRTLDIMEQFPLQEYGTQQRRRLCIS